METRHAPVDSGEGSSHDYSQRLSELIRVAGSVQHEVNNPLAALLAESQLLVMDPALGAEQRDSVQRIVDLTRRVISTVRKLDAVRAEEPAR